MCLSLSSQESEEGPSPLLQPVPSSSLFLHSLGFGQNSASFLALALILSPSKQPCFCRWSFEQWGGGGGGLWGGRAAGEGATIFSVCRLRPVPSSVLVARVFVCFFCFLVAWFLLLPLHGSRYPCLAELSRWSDCMLHAETPCHPRNQ